MKTLNAAGTFEIAFHAQGDQLWTYNSATGPAPNREGFGVMANSSPSVTALSNGGFQVAFAGSDGFLWEYGAAAERRVGAGLDVAPGTSPSIAAASSGGYEIAFHALGDQLWTVDDNVGHPNPDGFHVLTATSPSVTSLPSGGYQIAFVGLYDSLLWEAGTAGDFRASAGLGVAAGTSPSITAGPYGVGYEIAFHAQGDHLWSVTPDNVGHDLGTALSAGTSPTIASPVQPVKIDTLAADTPFNKRTITVFSEVLSLRAGESRRLVGQVNSTSPSSAVVEYDAGIQCLNAAGQQVGDAAWTAKNHTSTAALALDPSLLFTAPTAGTYTCQLLTDSFGNQTALAGSTWLHLDTTDDAGAQSWHNPECDGAGIDSSCVYLGGGNATTSYLLYNDGTQNDPTQKKAFTAAANATSIAVNANASMTTCFTGTDACVPTKASYGNSGSSTIVSHLEAVQLDAAGSTCNVTATSDLTSTISASVHHYSIPYALGSVPVLSSCGSRNFIIRISMHLAAGNRLKIDGYRPDWTGTPPQPEAETYAMAVNGK
ncbi:hypothetical protein [Streptacidiphilus sp. PAMC 29251]